MNLLTYATPDNVTDLTTWLIWSNTAVNGWLGILFVLLTFVVFFMVFSRFGGLTSFTLSVFITTIVAIMLRVIGIVNDYVIIFCVVFMILAVLGLKFAED